MEERLKELIELFHEKEVVKRITSKKSTQEAYEEYQKIEAESEKEIEKFRQEYLTGIEYDVKPEDSIEICLICMMAGINDDELLNNYQSLTQALRQVTEEQQEIAERFAHFLGYEEDDDTEVFCEYEIEELIEKFFG